MSDSKLPRDIAGKRIHAVGIKGTGLCALVEILKKSGAIITGSDTSDIFYTDEVLKTLGITSKLFDAANITSDIDVVIHSAAYKNDNVEIAAACAMGIPTMLYTEALGDYSSRFYSVGVCGVHGKTSTTGLVGSVLKQLPHPFQVLAGSAINSFNYESQNGATSGYKKNNTLNECHIKHCTYTSDNFNAADSSSIFVAETCEYQRHFMSFHPAAIILTAVESDHEDYYPTLRDIEEAFVDYICKLPRGALCVYCKSDKGAADTIALVKEKRSDIRFITYGTDSDCDYCVKYLGVEHDLNNFSVNGVKYALRVPGRHEVLDAAAAVALVLSLDKGADKGAIARGLIDFSGGARRSEIVGRTTINGNDVLIMDDYGHHPTAIKTTLSGFKDYFRGRKMIVDFMSHTYSRTAALLDEFAKCFGAADVVILHKIYSSARENPKDFSITGRTLFDRVKEHNSEVYYTDEILDAKDLLIKELSKSLDKSRYPNGYLFITMGAGDNFKLGRAVLLKQ